MGNNKVNMKKTIQIDYGDEFYLDTRILDKLKEMGIIKIQSGSIQLEKAGTLVIEFIEE